MSVFRRWILKFYFSYFLFESKDNFLKNLKAILCLRINDYFSD